MKVHSLLDSLGLSYIWSSQIHTSERLMDQFIQEWQSRVAEKTVVIIVYLKRNFALRNI